MSFSGSKVANQITRSTSLWWLIKAVKINKKLVDEENRAVQVQLTFWRHLRHCNSIDFDDKQFQTAIKRDHQTCKIRKMRSKCSTIFRKVASKNYSFQFHVSETRKNSVQLLCRKMTCTDLTISLDFHYTPGLSWSMSG